jgi:hypothetical protein
LISPANIRTFRESSKCFTPFYEDETGTSPIATFIYFNETKSCVGFVAFFVSLQQNWTNQYFYEYETNYHWHLRDAHGVGGDGE